MTFSSVVVKKGVHAYSIVRASNDITLLGHQKVIIKTDNEPSILALKESIKVEASQRIQVEDSLEGTRTDDSRRRGKVMILADPAPTIL